MIVSEMKSYNLGRLLVAVEEKSRGSKCVCGVVLLPRCLAVTHPREGGTSWR